MCVLATYCFQTFGRKADVHSATLQERTLFAMDTVMHFSVYDASNNTFEKMFEKVNQLENMLSVTKPNSAIYQLNTNGTGKANDELIQLLQKTLSLCEKSEGALDITLYPILQSWGFTQNTHHIPTDDELNDVLPLVDYRKVSIHADTITLPKGMKLDFGAVAKGYTGDVLCNSLRHDGITSALLNLGGNVQTLGTKPDGSLWKIGIQNPLSEDWVAVVEVDNKAVVTSGGYERYFEDDAGHIYWHILNPKTGKPAQNGLISVTIIGEEGFLCDGLSTALFVQGLSDATDFWRKHPTFEAVFITEDNEIYITEGLTPHFTLTNDAFDVQVIQL